MKQDKFENPAASDADEPIHLIAGDQDEAAGAVEDLSDTELELVVGGTRPTPYPSTAAPSTVAAPVPSSAAAPPPNPSLGMLPSSPLAPYAPANTQSAEPGAN